jgi:hypothetical protein
MRYRRHRQRRLFPLSRDELVECAALLDSVRRDELDRLVIPEQPLEDVRATVGSRYGEILPTEDHLLDPPTPRLRLPAPIAMKAGLML